MIFYSNGNTVERIFLFFFLHLFIHVMIFFSTISASREVICSLYSCVRSTFFFLLCSLAYICTHTALSCIVQNQK